MIDSRPLRAIGYTRVSTVGQVEDGTSLELQEQRIASFCTEHGWTLVSLIEDAGESGGKRRRQGVAELRRRVEAGDVDVVVVYDQSRLARDAEFVLGLIYSTCIARGVQFISITQDIDYISPEGRLMATLLGGTDEFQRRATAKRVRDTRTRHREIGKWWGRAPCGYRVDTAERGRLVPDTQCPPGWSISPAAAVQLVFRLYVDEGIGAWRIAQRLQQLAPREPPWRVLHILAILRRITYLGRIPYRGKSFPGNHDALVSEEVFRRANEILATRPKHAREKSPHLLSGILRCPTCGRSMVGGTFRIRSRSKQYEGKERPSWMRRRYVCSILSRGHGQRLCRGGYRLAARAERLVVGMLRALADGASLETVEIAPPRDEARLVDSLRRELAALPAREDRLLDLLGRSTISEEQFSRAMGHLTAERQSLQRDIAEMQRTPKAPARRLRATLRDLVSLLEDPAVPMVRKRAALAERVAWVTIGLDGKVKASIYRDAHVAAT